MFPAIHFGPLSFSTYTIVIDLGVVAALAWLWFRAPAHGRESSRWLDAGLAATAAGFLGGRIGFAVGNWAYFQNHFFEIFKLWDGGYTWIGAVLGGLAGLGLYGRWRAEPVRPLLDELALPAVLLSALSWFGCIAAACAAGRDAPPGALPFAVNWPDLYGVILPRWPTQPIGLALSLGAAGLLFGLRNVHWPAGLRSALALTLLAVIACLVSTVQGDDIQHAGAWRLDTLANAFMIGLGLIAAGAVWALEPAKPNALIPKEPPTA